MTPARRPVYYNEIDPGAVAWLRELIDQDCLPFGLVDDRSVWDVSPSDLAGFRQCHFFAGIGGWALALDLAGWGDRPCWTGSCPCQPFSAAGANAGFADERHLWPAWHWLIQQCRPPIVFGEQVENAIGHGWLDLVGADLEDCGYALGAAVLPAAGVGAPHRRYRLWFVGDRAGAGRDVQPERDPGTRHRPSAELGRSGDAGELGESGRAGSRGDARAIPRSQTARGGERLPARGLADLAQPPGGGVGSPGSARLPDRESEAVPGAGRGRQGGAVAESGRAPQPGPCRAVADHDPEGCEQRPAARVHADGEPGDDVAGCGEPRHLADHQRVGRERGPHPRRPAGEDPAERGEGVPDVERGRDPDPHDPWADAVWIPCRDGKQRPTQPGLFPLADGVPGRVGLLRGAGNAIVPAVAAAFVSAYLDLGRC